MPKHLSLKVRNEPLPSDEPDRGAEQPVYVPATTRILIASDSPILRSALRLLVETRPGLHVSLETTTCPLAVGKVDINGIDAALLDFDLNDSTEPRMRCLRELLEALGGVPGLILTGEPTFEACQFAFQFGVKGLILKNNSQYDLFGAIARVRRGEVWLEGPALAKLFAESFHQKRVEDDNIAKLTKREREIIRIAGRGLTNRQIGQQLCISEATVRHHLSAIFDKLGVATRSALIAFAYCYRLADTPDPEVDWRSWVASGQSVSSVGSSAPVTKR